MRIAALVSATVVLSFATGLTGQTPAPRPLEIYVIDAEGGKAVLYVSPSGQSVLVDSGSPGGRDTDRLMLALADARVTKLDYVVSTHYHVDHVGGLQELAKRIPIAHFIDHGESAETREQVAGFQQMYADLFAKAKHTAVKAGDVVPVAGLDWRVVTSNGQGLKAPLPGVRATPNTACAGFKHSIDARTWGTPDDDRSVGSVITLGKFRVVDFGDLLWDNAMALTCPDNLLGTVDLYMVTGHGAEVCSAAPFVNAIAPRVAIMQNGTRKGGDVASLQTLRSSPRLQDVWQLHWGYKLAIEHNSPGALIANIDNAATMGGVLAPPPPPHTPAYWIKVSAWPDGSFNVTNSRTGFTRTYAPGN